jgi:parvulin-like peptidyl-prolyl isomerase
MKRSLYLSLWCIGLVLSAGAPSGAASPKASIPPDSLLAKVNGETVSVGRFYDFLRESEITAKDPAQDEETKQESLHKLIREMLIDQRIASLNMESDPRFVATRDKHMTEWLLDYMHKKDLQEPVKVSDQEVRDHYQKYRDVDFVIPAEVEVRDLLIRVWADSTQKDYQKKLKKADREAKKKIERLYKKVKQGEDFVELCRENTQAGVPDRTGNLGFVKEGQMSPEFDQAAFSLMQSGEISAPFRDPQGYHLVQLLDRKEEGHYELDSLLFGRIEEYLRNEKIQEATDAFVDSLMRQTQFVFNWEVLNSPQPPADRSVWVLAFGQGDTIRYAEYAEVLSNFKFDAGLDSVSAEEKRFLLRNHLALAPILRKEAEKRGYADLVEYAAEERSFTLEEARKKFESTRVKRDFPPATREELVEYYQNHKAEFPPLGASLHVYHMVFDDSAQAAEVLSEIKQGQNFVTLAKMYFPGEPEMRGVAYDLGFIHQGEMPDEFYQAALALKVGQVSEPVKTKWGYHLIKLVERKKQKTSFEDVMPAIQRAIDLQKGRQSIAEWERELFDQATVWINEGLLSKLELPKPEG